MILSPGALTQLEGGGSLRISPAMNLPFATLEKVLSRWL
jgi:hypothetical protein